MQAAEQLDTLVKQIEECTSCVLHHSRKKSVPGTGPYDARIMLIGEGPGFHENEKGLPFVGAAGKFLDQLLEAGGLNRKTVFITNVVKCRPPGNRDPQAEELAACSHYLEEQIKLIDPLVIVTLGRFSMARYLPGAKISRIHGQATWLNGKMIVPMYHPAAALHQGKLKPVIMEDFRHILKWVEEAEKKRELHGNKPVRKFTKPTPILPEDNEDPEQLSLF